MRNQVTGVRMTQPPLKVKQLENITSQFGLHQMIDEPTHILESSSSCIDLIFTSQPNLITESGVHPSLHPNSHHKIIFAKLNLKIQYSPFYFRDLWHYQDANTNLIRGTTDIFDWDRAVINTNFNEKVFILNKTILNILSNFIPHKTLTADDKEHRWIIKKISSKRKTMFIKAIEIVKTATTYIT